MDESSGGFAWIVPESDEHCITSKAPVLRENNNNVNFSIDVLYFVPENLKKVQESC
jgi:hypothetical protein